MSAEPDNSVLIHGLFLESRSCWIERYSSRGHRVLAPSWPGPPEGTRAVPGPA